MNHLTTIYFLLGPFFLWLPKIFLGIIFFLAVILFFLEKKNEREFLWLNYKKLIFITILFYLLYAAALTLSQYYVWSQNDFTKLLLTSPLDERELQPIFKNFFWLFNHKLGYFLFYVLGRFWFQTFLTILSASFFYFFLNAISHYREAFFKPGEKELGFLMGLIVGWPNFVIFLPMVFFFMILLSAIRRFFLKEYFTTIGLSLLLSAFITLIFGNELISVFHLTALLI